MKRHKISRIQKNKITNTNLCFKVRGAEETRKCIPNEYKFMSGYNQTLPSGNKDTWWLVPLHTGEESLYGVRQAGEMRQTLG